MFSEFILIFQVIQKPSLKLFQSFNLKFEKKNKNSIHNKWRHEKDTKWRSKKKTKKKEKRGFDFELNSRVAAALEKDSSILSPRRLVNKLCELQVQTGREENLGGYLNIKAKTR